MDEIYEFGPLTFTFRNPKTGRKKSLQLHQVGYIDEPKGRRKVGE